MSAPSSSNRDLAFRIERVATTTSTMDDVAQWARAGADEGLVVVADFQSAGRGRAGRTWQAPPGSALQCSLLLRPRVEPRRLSVLPLILGVAIAEGLELSAPIQCQLKWPNDLWVRERKIGGILVTARSGSAGVEHAIVGFGINLSLPLESLPEGATSVKAETNHSIEIETLLASILERVRVRYQEFCRSDPAPLRHWHERAALIGEWVTVVDRGTERTGRLRGVNDDGALLLDVDGAIVEVVAGDLSRGPRRGVPSSLCHD